MTGKARVVVVVKGVVVVVAREAIAEKQTSREEDYKSKRGKRERHFFFGCPK